MKLSTLCVLLAIIPLCLSAEVAQIPDANLERVLRDALTVPAGTPITEADMRQLTTLDAAAREITNLTGLESATNLTELRLGENPVTDISPLADLTQLTFLRLNDCWTIEDISPLEHLTQLNWLDLDRNIIVDIGPLAGLMALTALDIRFNQIENVSPLAALTQLTQLRLDNNKIEDVSPLATLTRLEILRIRWNSVMDHSPLDGLPLTDFLYDQICEIPPLPLSPRIKNRTYPSIVARWGARNPALYDLSFDGLRFNLYFLDTSHGVAIAGPVDRAIQLRDEYLAINPNMVSLVDIRMREEWAQIFPEDWPYWIRDTNGDVVSHWPGANLLDFTHPYVQDRIVQQAIAVSKCGLFDGIFFDYWHERIAVLGGFRTLEAEQRARDNILQRIRAATRPNFLIMGNTNDNVIPRTAPYVNGGFMETGIPEIRTGADLEQTINEVENSLIWLENNLREPRINGLEGYSLPGEPLDSPDNRRWMRMLTTLSLTHSDGYVLYSESLFSENPTGSIWYDFWDADLGHPIGPKVQLYDEDVLGLYIREFTNGWAVYNHSRAAQVITLPEEVQGVASELVGMVHTLPNLDGEIYLRVKPPNPADVNRDGVVNILDLVAVAQAIGTGGAGGDVNGDGVVNVFDLVMVAGEIQ